MSDFGVGIRIRNKLRNTIVRIANETLTGPLFLMNCLEKYIFDVNDQKFINISVSPCATSNQETPLIWYKKGIIFTKLNIYLEQISICYSTFFNTCLTNEGCNNAETSTSDPSLYTNQSKNIHQQFCNFLNWLDKTVSSLNVSG